MRPQRVAVLALPVLLSSCALGAYFSPITALEHTANGLYEGEGNGITGRVPYRFTLTLQEKSGRANGVLVNLESQKTYTGSGSFKRTPSGGYLDLNFFENGSKYRAVMHAELTGQSIIGQVKTVLLGQQLFPYNINLKKLDLNGSSTK